VKGKLEIVGIRHICEVINNNPKYKTAGGFKWEAI
jgi:hypothetical protein